MKGSEAPPPCKNNKALDVKSLILMILIWGFLFGMFHVDLLIADIGKEKQEGELLEKEGKDRWVSLYHQN